MLRNKGFTLIELMVVISILAVLAAIILAALQNTRSSANVAAGLEFDEYNYHAFGDNAFVIYKFNDPSNYGADSSGNAYDLNPPLSVGNMSADTPNKNGHSLLSGSSRQGWLWAPSETTPESTSAQSYTLSVWVNTNSIDLCSTNDDVIIGYQLNSGVFGGIFICNNGNNVSLQCGYGSNNSPKTISKDISIQQNIWYQLTCSLNNISQKGSLYLDGNNILTTPLGTVDPFNINNLTLGDKPPSVSNYYQPFNGIIWNVAVYLQSLTN